MSKADDKSLVKLGTKKAQKVLEQIHAIDPSIVAQAQSPLDEEQIFQLYCSFTGDLQRTAHAASVTPQVVAQLAEEHKWAARLSAIFDLKKSGRPGDLEKCLSRAINFVQAHRMRIVLERLIGKLYAMTPDELLEECTTAVLDKEGNEVKRTLSMKPLSDLCAALEKVHALTYMSLSDSASERIKRHDSGDAEVSLSSVHSLISQAMANTQNTAKREEFSVKLAQAKEALQPNT